LETHADLEEDVVFNPRCTLKSGLTTRAEIARKEVRITLVLELKDRMSICYPNQRISNMMEWKEMHRGYMIKGDRIPLVGNYKQEENRPERRIH
jgi:hypothetical protein